MSDAAVRRAATAFAELRREPVVLALLAACGAGECHLVGGALRDRALGLVTRDLDAVVAGRGGEIAGELAVRLPARLVALGGKEFASYRLVLRPPARDGAQPPGQVAGAVDQAHETRGMERIGEGPGIAAALGGGSAAGSAGIDVVDLWDRGSTPLADDLARRDFTVNSFALEPRSGELIDPFGGLADLERRILRATTRGGFEGDPLRVLRLVRLALRLPGFTVEPETFDLARATAHRLAEVAAERIRDELWMVLSHPEAARGLRALAALDLYPGLWLGRPGVPAGAAAASTTGSTAVRQVTADASAGERAAAGPTDQAADRTAAERAALELAALPGCADELKRLLGAAATPGEAASGPDAGRPAIDLAAARFAATFRHLPAAVPAAPRAAAAGESELPLTSLTRMREAGFLTARQAAEIAPLLAGPPELPETELGRRRFLHRHGRRWATVACAFGAAAAAAAATGGGAALDRWRRAAGPLCELARREGPALIEPPRLLTGEDVQRLLGIPPGPEVGAALAALSAAQVEGAVRARDDAERFLREWRTRRPDPARADLEPT
jgi:poly(A) polymerase